MKASKSNMADTTPRADCNACDYSTTRLAGGSCKPGDACVVVESGRQIDRFFRNNPDLAQLYLDDHFWERRAIASRYSPIELLTALIHDEDEVVRRAIAYRIPIELLDPLITDPDREVRITVADRLPEVSLALMAQDPERDVRRIVARRMPAEMAMMMLNDSEWMIRFEAAMNVEPAAHEVLRNNPETEIRALVIERLDE